MLEIILYILALMIFYDLSIHLVYLLNKEKFFLNNKLNWWPGWDRWGKTERRKYQTFWITYWGIAFILILMLIVIR